MKIGFTSLACPGWDLETMIGKAAALGYDGVELRGVRGELHLPLVPELAARPDAVRRLLAEHKIELLCLATSVTLDSKRSSEVAHQKEILFEFVELARKLGAPYVRMFVGEVQRRDNVRVALARIAEELISLAPIVARHKVTLLVENGGDFPGANDMWFLMDAVDHPNVRICWNQCAALTMRERATYSIPRLGNKIGMVHLSDATFDDSGVLLDFVPPGEGQAEVGRQIEILKGLVYDRYLMFEWPRLWVESLQAADSILPAAAKFMREKIDEKQSVLSAYKGDKNAPRLASRRSPSAAPT